MRRPNLQNVTIVERDAPLITPSTPPPELITIDYAEIEQRVIDRLTADAHRCAALDRIILMRLP
jgi:hypothetical protein